MADAVISPHGTVPGGTTVRVSPNGIASGKSGP